MDRLSSTVDQAFREALRGDTDLLDRLGRLAGHHVGLGNFHDICAAQAERYWPKPMRDRAKAKAALHYTAARTINRRVARLIRKGVL